MKKLIATIAVTMIMTTSAWALEPSGTYTYKEKGYSGDMTVTRPDPNLASWNVKILTVESRDAHLCEVEGVIGNIVSDDNSVETVFMADEGQGKFTVNFTKTGAVIDVSENGGFCGMNGNFGGKWTKAVAKSKSKKMKK